MTLFILVLINDGFDLPIYQVILLYFVIVIGFTTFLLLLTIMGGLYDFVKRRKAFQQENWRKFFTNHNFETIPVLRKKYDFAEEAKIGLIEGIPVLAEISPDKKSFFKLNFFAVNDSVSRELVNQFKAYNAKPEGEYFYKLLKKLKDCRVSKLKKR